MTRKLFIRRLLVRWSALALCAVMLLGACGGSDSSKKNANRDGPTATAPLPPGTSEIAETVVGALEVFDAPDGSLIHTFDNPWFINDDPKLGVPLVFLVQERQREWLKVVLPVRPNGSTGWIRSRDVLVTHDPYRIVVELAAHRITVYQANKVLFEEPIAVGKPETPTPTGTYFIRALLKAPDPDTVYGPYAYGLSGHSDVLETFNGGDAELGIHGNNDASVLGTSVSAGCIRMSNDGITRLTGLLPLGTPVEITA